MKRVFVLIFLCFLATFTLPSIRHFHNNNFNRDGYEAPGTFQKFYRVKIDVTYDKTEPVSVEYVLACRLKIRKFIGESDARYVRVPRVYGVATKGGQGIMTATPDICGYDLKKIVPDDFLPVMFYAEKAGDMSFFTAYLTEKAYDQSFSHLTFQKATISEANLADYEKWLKESPPNIVPQVEGPWWAEVFNSYYWARTDSRYKDFDGDPRNFGQIECTSLVKRSLPKEVVERLRTLWPSNHPQYWVLTEQSVMQRIYGWGGRNSREFQIGIRRPNGGGALNYSQNKKISPTEYEPQIPYYRTDLYPNAIPKEPIKFVDYIVSIADGADQGFAYCYRGWGGRVQFKYSLDGRFRVAVDGALFSEVPFTKEYPKGYPGIVIEEDKNFLNQITYSFEEEWAKMR
jgi:hypothetical protein